MNKTQLSKSKFEHLLTPAVLELNKVTQNAGFELRIVGGAVRDLVIGKDPKDIDMSTTATPDEMMALLRSAGIRYEPTGLQHGTITAVLDGEPIEITTLRVDKDTDGRHARVEFVTDWKLDAERRDLTFNAMSMTMDGVVYDYFGGVEDLQNSVARFVGDAEQRIREDFLRILRYFRFQGRLENPTWDKATLDTIRKNANGLQSVSGERIWMEMSKIFERADTRDDVLKKMRLTRVLPAISMPAGRIGKLETVSSNPVVALAMLMETTGELDSVRSRWKFSTAEYKTAMFVLENRDKQFDLSVAQRLVTRPKTEDTDVVALAEALGQFELVKQLADWVRPVFPVTGQDLTSAGVTPGPNMGKMLLKMRATWEESNFTLTREELLKESND